MSSRLRLMIVDDDPLFRRSLRELLAPDFDIVMEAASGDEAIEAVAAGGIDLIVMDVGMPRVSGLEATRAIVERDPALAIVIVSGGTGGTGDPGTGEAEARAAGARAYVQKSSSLTDLAELLIALASV